MMYKRYNHLLLPIIVALLLTLLTISCSKDQVDLISPKEVPTFKADSEELTPTQGVLQGVIRVQLSENIVNSFSVLADNDGTLRSGRLEMDAFLSSIGAIEMTPVFTIDPRFEKRMKDYGLHLFYDVTFKPEKSSTKQALRASKVVPEIIEAEEIPEYKLLVDHNNNTPALHVNINKYMPIRKGVEMPFNDPLLYKQWNYHNDGQVVLRSIAGADLNLFEAWKIETGKPSVIIGIADQAVDYAHEDLKESMHINEAELNGAPDTDNDGNGYKNDIYGYNFQGKGKPLDPGSHGTHVGGIVAARNNNGIGIGGVAGGNGTPESGVRMITTQVFARKTGGGGHAEALIYQANNGAVISQNSWGTDPGIPMDAAVQKAIDYFIEFAGCDAEGNQLPDAPMKGGLVIFAAGNEQSDNPSYPGAYYKVISVSAMGPAWEKAPYTNRGSHITIMAPGGDRDYPFGSVYSTVPEIDGNYAYMQGTSMACPHVSGVAGLIVSKFGGLGFTNEQAKQLLISAFRPENIDLHNPGFEGRLGRGYLDAAMALKTNGEKAPGTPADVVAVPAFTSVDLSWTVPSDPDDGIPATYTIFYATTQLNNTNLMNEGVKRIEVKGQQAKVGEKLVQTITKMDLSTKYYFAIQAKDRWGLTSDVVFVETTTKTNHPPVIIREDNESIRLTGKERKTITLKVTDPEGHPWRYQLKGSTRGVHAEVNENVLRLTFTTAPNYGKHTLEVVIIDDFNFKTVLEIPFEIYENTPPQLQKDFKQLYLPIGEKQTYDLSEYFIDIDGHDITYTARAIGTSAVQTTLEGHRLTVQGSMLGRTSIEITASDTQNATTRIIFRVQVVNDELAYMVYPIPATKELNIVLSHKVKRATFEIRSETGVLAMKQEVDKIVDQKVTLDVSSLSGGSYILHIITDQGSMERSFIKY